MEQRHVREEKAGESTNKTQDGRLLYKHCAVAWPRYGEWWPEYHDCSHHTGWSCRGCACVCKTPEECTLDVVAPNQTAYHFKENTKPGIDGKPCVTVVVEDDTKGLKIVKVEKHARCECYTNAFKWLQFPLKPKRGSNPGVSKTVEPLLAHYIRNTLKAS